jgi:hypothetical protein
MDDEKLLYQFSALNNLYSREDTLALNNPILISYIVNYGTHLLIPTWEATPKSFRYSLIILELKYISYRNIPIET